MHTQKQLQTKFIYEPIEGRLSNRNNGYEYYGHGILFEGHKYPASHIIWCLYYGEWPPKGILIDHKDRNRYNWRIDNLRLATHQQNGYNSPAKFFGAHSKGIYYCGRKTKPWQAQIRIEGQKVNLGRYRTQQEAKAVHNGAALFFHGEFACLE